MYPPEGGGDRSQGTWLSQGGKIIIKQRSWAWVWEKIMDGSFYCHFFHCFCYHGNFFLALSVLFQDYLGWNSETHMILRWLWRSNKLHHSILFFFLKKLQSTCSLWQVLFERRKPLLTNAIGLLAHQLIIGRVSEERDLFLSIVV